MACVIFLKSMRVPDSVKRARAFLRGERIEFAEADDIWRSLKTGDELSLARAVLERIRTKELSLSESIPAKFRAELCRQHAEITSKDPELDSGFRHDRALKILMEGFDFDSTTLDGDAETMGIAGGVYKRRWTDLGQLKDLLQAAKCYERGAQAPLGDDAYPHINCAFVEDLLANVGDRPNERRLRAKLLRQRITDELTPSRLLLECCDSRAGLLRSGTLRQSYRRTAERTAESSTLAALYDSATVRDARAFAGTAADGQS